MKKIFVVKTSDDGTIGVCTNKKEVVKMIAEYFKGRVWTYWQNEQKLYSKICADFSDGYYSSLEIKSAKTSEELEAETYIHKIEVEEFKPNNLYLSKNFAE
jgi:anthranilate/para-aminobenzoate synthase component II